MKFEIVYLFTWHVYDVCHIITKLKTKNEK